MSRPHALITGIRGQDGTLLAQHLLARGWRVSGLARPHGLSFLDPARDEILACCRIVEDDIARAGVIEDAIADLAPTAVFHLAAVHHSSDGGHAPIHDLNAAMTAVNFSATERLLRAILRWSPDTRLVFAASSQIWTPRYVGELVDEATPRKPATYYGLTKSWAMDCLAHYRERLGVHAATAILFNHESPLRPASFVARKISVAAARAALGEAEPLELRNIGAAVDWSAARDIVGGLSCIAEALAPGDYILASGTSRTIRDVLEIAFSSVGHDWTDYVRALADQSTPHLVGNVGRARRELGWRPDVALETVVQEMVQADLRRLRLCAPEDLMHAEGF
jgi:GDPmannose 4,6-dehydratase